MKNKQLCVSRRVEVKTRDSLRSEHCVVVVQELIKHLLYMRNQIPGLFEDLEWQTQASYISLNTPPNTGLVRTAASLLCAGTGARKAIARHQCQTCTT